MKPRGLNTTHVYGSFFHLWCSIFLFFNDVNFTLYLYYNSKRLLFSGEKNKDQWTNKKIARACSNHGQGKIHHTILFVLWLIVYFVFVMLTFLSYWQQTSTAEMLDLALDYIKDLQKQFKVLNGRRKFDNHAMQLMTFSCMHWRFF